MGGTLGPILYQLPPRWRCDLPRFAHFLNALPDGYRHVIEFRDSSWLREEVFQLMERHGVAHCIHDLRPLEVPLRHTAPRVYIRCHGDPAHGGNYPQAALDTWAKLIAEWRRPERDIFVYFNNDVGGYAIDNARTLRHLLKAGE